MRILLLGEYSNVHATLADGLRQLGNEVTVVSNGDFWKNYPRDIDVSRSTGRLGGMRLAQKLYTQVLPKLRHYDIVQLINPIFFELKAERLFPIYRYLRRHNKRIILGSFGMDWYWVDTCTNKRPLRYSDFNIGDTVRNTKDTRKEWKDWINTPKEQLNKLIAADCDGIVTSLYEYWVCYHPCFPEKTTFIPQPIYRQQHPVSSREPGQKIRLFIGINRDRNEYKGTDIMLRAAEDIVRKYPDRIELVKAVSVPFAEYQHLMDGADAILDQLYSYTPSMNSLLAMSKGIIDIGGGEPENYDILGEQTLRPIVNVQPTQQSVYEELEQLVLHPERVALLKQQSIEYTEKHHDHLKVARQYLDFYKACLSSTND